MIEITRNGSQYPAIEFEDSQITFLTQSEYDMLSDEEKYNNRCYAVIDGAEKIAVNNVYAKNGNATYTGLYVDPQFQFYDSKKMLVSGPLTAKDAGTYQTTFTPKEGYCWIDGSTQPRTVEWHIGVAIPEITSELLVYSGSAQSPTYSNYDATQMTRTGDTSATNAGNYTMTFTLLEGRKWADGTTDPKVLNWSIAKQPVEMKLVGLDVTYFAPGSTKNGQIIGPAYNAIQVTSSDTSVVTGSVNSSKVLTLTGKAAGEAVVTVEVPETGNYSPSRIDIPVNVKYTTMTVNINLSNSNSSTWSTYADDAVGLSKGDERFLSFFGHYPVRMSGTSNYGRLDPNDFTKCLDGTASYITSSYEPMIRFPKRGLKISKTSSTGTLTVSMTDNPNADGYEYNAHDYNGSIKSAFYVGCYKAYLSSNCYYTRSGVNYTVTSNSMSYFRQYSAARGTRYSMIAYYQHLYIVAMYTIMYGGQDSYKVYGCSNTNNTMCGVNDKSGMDVKRPSSSGSIKMFGLEDYNGGYPELLEGIYSYNRGLYAATGNYSTTSSYTQLFTVSSNITSYYYLKNPHGTTKGGFMQYTTDSGSSTTYFAGYQNQCPYLTNSTTYYYFKHSYSATTSEGNIYSMMGAVSSSTSFSSAVRLMYMPAS